jgi:hypothetical protein
MVVEDQLDGGVCRIGGIELLEKTDELSRAMAVLDACMNPSRQQVDPCKQAQRAVALVFMVTRPTRMRSRLRRQIRGGVANRLDAGLLVVRDDRNIRPGGLVLAQDLDLAINLENRGGWLGRDTVSVSISGTSAG